MELKTVKVYRIEIPEDKNGMWYNKNGVFQKKIHILCPNGIAKDIPMPLNLALHRKDGDIWNSAGASIEQMNAWFSPQDAVNLMNGGFKLFEFVVSKFQELEFETLFTRSGIISQRTIPLETVWDIKNLVAE